MFVIGSRAVATGEFGSYRFTWNQRHSAGLQSSFGISLESCYRDPQSSLSSDIFSQWQLLKVGLHALLKRLKKDDSLMVLIGLFDCRLG